MHAGVYTSLRGGAAREHGLELKVRAPSASTDSLKLLAAGRADAAIVDIHDIGLARERGADLVGVVPVVERPLAAVIAKPEVRRPRELEGRTVGISGLPSDTAVLRSVVADDGGDPERVRTRTIGFSAVPSLASGRVDAVVAFWNAEGVALRSRGRRTSEFRVDDFGAPSYPELVVCVRRATLDRDRELVERLAGALEQGAAEARRDPAAATREVARASGSDEKVVRAQLDAVSPAQRPPLSLERPVLEAWARFDRRFGVLKRDLDIDRAFALDLRPR